MGICVTLFLTLFASQYLAESLTGGSSFSEPLSKFTALYYTVTVFSTVGFGDITPVSNLARALTMCQMFGNLIVLGIGVRVLTSVAQESLEKKRRTGEGPAVRRSMTGRGRGPAHSAALLGGRTLGSDRVPSRRRRPRPARRLLT